MTQRTDRISGRVSVQRLLGLSDPAYQLAVRILGAHDMAEDAVQQAYLDAFRHLQSSRPPEEERTWFLRVVANAARKQRRKERSLKRREKALQPANATPQSSGNILGGLRVAMEVLEEKYRVPIALCYEQNLTQREAAAILNMPERTVSKYVNAGLEKLRKALERAGYPAAVAAVLGGLKGTAPAVPASLAGRVEVLVAKGAVVETGGGTAAAAVKGGIAMKVVAGVLAAGALAGAVAVSTGMGGGASPAVGDGKPAPVNPYKGMQTREEVYEFTAKPAVKKEGDKWVITFASKGKCDATVAILDKDGKIVRHLASGVLGPNAPHPFQQNTLSQKIEWDGLTDDFKKAPAGCKVRVSLGLKVDYARSIAYASNAVAQSVQALAVDGEGMLYVVGLAGDQIKVFDREGKYVRTAWPFPGNLKPESVKGVVWSKTEDGFVPLPAFMYEEPGMPGSDPMGCRTLPITREDRMVSVNGIMGSRFGWVLILRGTKAHDKDITLGVGVERPASGFAPGGRRGTFHVALSPDDTCAYIAGGKASAVWRAKLSELKPVSEKGGHLPKGAPLPEVFAGEPNKKGSDAKHFDNVQGLATDAQGNLYVCDTGNNRVQVLKPDGSLLRSIAVENPWGIAVNPKTQDAYVYSATTKDAWKKPAGRITKFSAEGKSVASVEVPFYSAYLEPPAGAFCLDANATPPILWVYEQQSIKGAAKRAPKRIRRLVDRGNKLEDAGEIPLTRFPWNRVRQAMAVSRTTEALYVKPAGRCFPHQIFRFDGKTGEEDRSFTQLNIQADEVATGYDGLAYLRVNGPGSKSAHGRRDDVGRINRLIRLDHANKPVPFPGGVAWKQKWGGSLATKAIALPGLQKSACRTFQRGIAVAPNGDVYAFSTESGATDFGIELRKAGQISDDLLSGKKRLSADTAFLYVVSPDGKVKTISAIDQGITHACGLRVGRSGAVYIANPYLPGLKPKIVGLAPGEKGFSDIGSLLKFGSFPGPGKFVGRVDVLPRGSSEKPTHHYGRNRYAANVKVKGLQWMFAGVSRVRSTGCICGDSRFDLDGFERSFVPARHVGSVFAVDANGNRIARIGRYGNADSQGPDSLVPEPDIGLCNPTATAVSDTALYIADPANRRILKAKLGYHAEEELPLP